MIPNWLLLSENVFIVWPIPPNLHARLSHFSSSYTANCASVAHCGYGSAFAVCLSISFNAPAVFTALIKCDSLALQVSCFKQSLFHCTQSCCPTTHFHIHIVVIMFVSSNLFGTIVIIHGVIFLCNTIHIPIFSMSFSQKHIFWVHICSKT